MNKIYLQAAGAGLLLCSATLIMSHRTEGMVESFHETTLNSGGAPSARTGAPGESSCVSCHSGSAQDGNNGINELVLDGGGTDYDPGVSNSMTLTLTDAANKNGFELVALDDNDEMAGSFTITDATNTQTVSNSQLSRDYVTHTSNGNSQSVWSFDWDAPTGSGDVTFYVATNKTNFSGTNSGDVIYLSSHTFSNPQLSASEEEKAENPFEVGYSPSEHALHLDFSVENETEVAVNVVDLSGRSVYYNNEGQYIPGTFSEKVRLPEGLKNGIYSVTIFIGNQPFTNKVMITK